MGEIRMSEQRSLVELDRDTAVAPRTIYDTFAQMVRDPTIDPSRIAQFMELQQQAERWQAEKEFIAAMNRLQPRLPRIEKRGKIAFESKRTGESQATPYALLEDIDEKVRPLLHDEGFVLTFGTSMLEKGGILITATLSHAAGHSRTESMPLPFDTSGSKNSIQAVGSTLSYGKRYLTCAMLNIVTVGIDDDGNAVGYIDERQTNNIIDMFSACDMDIKSQSKFLEFMKVETVGEIRRGDYGKAMTMLQKKLQQKEGRA
jgi:ERF superfamily